MHYSTLIYKPNECILAQIPPNFVDYEDIYLATTNVHYYIGITAHTLVLVFVKCNRNPIKDCTYKFRLLYEHYIDELWQTLHFYNTSRCCSIIICIFWHCFIFTQYCFTSKTKIHGNYASVK